ncbi:hypothetical protein BATDEDRAFT_24111 [Batrachochytrium dendrobatidis JAM81]|uniref:Uncharacterized protein n=1 Tax=Batrachochytrium dendrobatidis (strain JAM81 / FGSC 10211) TaxID=684364 RepID=F4P0E3_BATDJ|nr:uncharacterized protein BATDEDRAFT_24111 [Batrachochytrium dendrobatidis JAM81]EGF81573.1 hypothetical protein BATDEDRAFT_24111 [Batrachochytrium dendrobatidis JAM81]|eukprot:XP_006677912.1 hypothetical protein BATDEDRAFT_24111 [Batrachochytrium dendrobatidis JAM81]
MPETNNNPVRFTRLDLRLNIKNTWVAANMVWKHQFYKTGFKQHYLDVVQSAVFILEIKDYYETRDSAGVVTKLVIYYKDLSKLVKNSNLPKMGHYEQKSRGATVDSL